VPRRCECREVHIGLPWTLYVCMRCIFPLSLFQTLLNEVPRRCACREVHGETATDTLIFWYSRLSLPPSSVLKGSAICALNDHQSAHVPLACSSEDLELFRSSSAMLEHDP
jgi:hypothetical protein